MKIKCDYYNKIVNVSPEHEEVVRNWIKSMEADLHAFEMSKDGLIEPSLRETIHNIMVSWDNIVEEWGIVSQDDTTEYWELYED
jgi:hypothetical protein